MIAINSIKLGFLINLILLIKLEDIRAIPLGVFLGEILQMDIVITCLLIFI
jgi:hypothetical protein